MSKRNRTKEYTEWHRGYQKERLSERKLVKEHRLAYLVSSARTRAKAKGYPFDIDNEYIVDMWEEQEGRCCLTNRPFELVPSSYFRVNPNTPSIDRIIPELGYTKGNVRLVTWQINCAISDYGLENFLSMCRDINDHLR